MKKYLFKDGEKIRNPEYNKLEKQFQKEILNVKRLYYYKWKDDPKTGKGKIIETPTAEYRAFQRKWRKILSGDTNGKKK